MTDKRGNRKADSIEREGRYFSREVTAHELCRRPHCTDTEKLTVNRWRKIESYYTGGQTK